MTVELPNLDVPAGAELTVRIELSTRVNITSYVAQQSATRFAIAEISNQVRGEVPSLVVGERLCWSVPLLLTSPGRGAIGRVGALMVDATTGEILTDADTIAEMIDHAEHLAR